MKKVELNQLQEKEALKSLLKKAEICLRLEDIIYETTLLSEKPSNCTIPQWREREDDPFFGSIHQAFESTNSDAEEVRMCVHMDLYRLTSYTLPEGDFEMKFTLDGLELEIRDHLRGHNKDCVIFFLSFYERMLRAITKYLNETPPHQESSKNLARILHLIDQFQETRLYFAPFCVGCTHHTVNKCQFWVRIAAQISAIFSRPPKARDLSPIWVELSELDTQCQFPRKYDQLIALIEKYGVVRECF